MTLHNWLAEWAGWGWALLANHLWQATLFSALVFPSVVLLRRGPSRVRYAIWVIAGLKFALPSALLGIVIAAAGFDLSASPISTEEGSDTLIAVSQFAAPVHQLSDVDWGTARPGGHNELYCGLTLGWLSGVAILLGLWVNRRRRFAKALKSGRVVTTGREAEALSRARLLLRATRPVSLIVSSRVAEPGVWRVFWPVILLPEGMADDLSDAELEAVLAHELIHVARWDNLVSNLHMMLCCLLWFHPLMWLIDRRLLNERERACDDAVIRLGGASEVYASSLLKVLKFCLGWRVAGVSYAAGSNLRRRVQRIMANDTDRKIRISHRVVVGTVVTLVVAFSITAGLVSREQVAAGVNALQAVASASGVSEDSAVGEGQEATDLNQELNRTPDRTIEFSNDSGSPVSITEASAKWVRIDERLRRKGGSTTRVSRTYFMKPSLKLVNNSERLIAAVEIEFKDADGKVKLYFERVSSLIGPHDSFSLNNRLVRFEGNPTSAVAKVVGVLFEDRTVWGSIAPPPPLPPPPPPPPPPPRRMKQDLPPPPPPPKPDRTEDAADPASPVASHLIQESVTDPSGSQTA